MLRKALFLGLLGCSLGAHANVYKFTVTNGGNMPISPGVLYSSTRANPDAHIGAAATAGFTKLCQTGMNSERAAELRSNGDIKSVVETAGPILPGESKTFEVTISEANVQGLHFEAMYGKTKDVCSVSSASRHNLVALSQHVVSSINGADQVLGTGSFTLPVATSDANALCSESKNAVECLRALSSPQALKQPIHAFSGYLPSLLSYLEENYGADDVQTLLVPTAGAVRFQLVLKH
jgi:hypothetical protein